MRKNNEILIFIFIDNQEKVSLLPGRTQRSIT